MCPGGHPRHPQSKTWAIIGSFSEDLAMSNAVIGTSHSSTKKTGAAGTGSETDMGSRTGREEEICLVNMHLTCHRLGCFECCIKCLGGIPYASLIATILLYAGVALFCGCGHEALSGTVNILQTYFEMARAAGDTLDVFTMIDIFKYVIYGIAAAFFVYGILLMVEGFFTTGAIKDLYGDFKITTCGRCVSAWFIMLTYIFMLAWLGVTAFTSLPVYMYFNLWTICKNTTLVEGANFCLDLRQFGIVTIGEEKKICTASENFLRMCESTELNMTFHLFIVALAGAGAAVIAMVHYLMVLSANWAYVKDACRMQKYEDIKSKEEQELHDIHSTRSKERLNAYT
ncbi:LOW QUALITY PROTEIN: neuronal membrane glycoprotein M6-a [Pantherophis guttatus]|uniref:Neuronal membrane glycoprotein M6-a n=3 Tax=Colubroidea TaxID=34989 RepID=A0ABM3Z2Y7_PANGU|nr:LOW QUALITY PROTEIN: neuronal membrane glycoprotein M6-a [Pantherophis guttatus]